MTLRLITGRANAGKTGVLHDAVMTATAEGRQTVVLLPTVAEVNRTRAEFASRSAVGIEVQTLDTWAERAWAVYGDGRRLVSQPARVAIATSVARGAAGPLESLTESRGLPGLVAELVSRTAGGDHPDIRSPVDQALFSLVNEYFRTLGSEELIEPGEMLVSLADSAWLSGAMVVVNRFTDISPSQERFLVGLSRSSEVLVSLTYEVAHHATEALGPLVERLVLQGAKVTHVKTDVLQSELNTIEERLFGVGDSISPEGKVVLAEAAGGEAEAALVASQVAGLIASGTPPHEIAVAFRDAFARRSILAAALAARKIDSVMDVAPPFARSPFGSALRALVLAAAGNGGRTDVMSYLQSPYSGVATAEVECFDAGGRSRRMVEVATVLQHAMNLGPTVEKAVRLARSAASGSVNDRAEEWAELAAQLVVTRAQNIEGGGHSPLDANAYHSLSQAICEVAQLTESVDAVTFLDSLATVPIASGESERRGAVYVTEAHRLRGRRFAAVIVGGLTAAEFSSELREPLVVSVLHRVGLPSGTEERLSERLLFYSLVTRARERLVLVKQRSDSAGKELRPSVFWDEIVDLYRTADQIERADDGALTTTVELPLSKLAEAAPSYTPERRELRNRVAEAGMPSPCHRGVLAKGAQPGPRDKEYSVTELESYHACPYRWFYDRVVSPEALDDGLDALKRGSYAHRVMSRFYERFRNEVAGRVQPHNLQEALALLGNVAEQVRGEPKYRTQGLLEELELSAADEWAKSLVAADAELFEGHEPVEHEWRFGTKAELPFAFAGVSVKGSIDRIDSSARGLIVTDYKSSKKVYEYGAFRQQGLLQAVVYAAAAEEAFGKPVVASLYRSLATGAFAGYWREDLSECSLGTKNAITPEEYSELRAWAAEAMQSAVRGIEAGEIGPDPRKDACKWCGIRRSCAESVR